MTIHDSRLTIHDSRFTSCISRLASRVSRLASRVSRLTSRVSRLTSHVSRLASRVSRFTSGVSRLTSSVSSFTIIALFLFSSCSDKSQIHNPKFQITDDAGVEVRFDSNPKRIISLAPNITEALFAIGADSLVVGVTDLCDFPSEAKNITKTGSYISPNYEVMTSLNPELIIINVENISNPTYQALKNMGMKVFVSNAKNVSGIIKMINEFGKITGKENSAETFIKTFNGRLNTFAERDTINSEPALILISVNPLMTTNGRTFINDILFLAGIHNLYKDESLDYPTINYEDVISKNPACIIFPTDTNNVEKVQKFLDEIKRQLKDTKAVTNNCIILIDDNIMFRPGPRVVDAAQLLKEKYYKNTN